MTWVGPFRFREYLDSVDVIEYPRPPRSSGIYLVSASLWQDVIKSRPFYVGKGSILCERVGDFIFSMLGFDGVLDPQKARHWGGMKLRVKCHRSTHRSKLLDYHIAWRVDGCPTCCEAALCEVLEPEANERRPQRCTLCDPWAVDRLLGLTF